MKWRWYPSAGWIRPTTALLQFGGSSNGIDRVRKTKRNVCCFLNTQPTSPTTNMTRRERHSTIRPTTWEEGVLPHTAFHEADITRSGGTRRRAEEAVRIPTPRKNVRFDAGGKGKCERKQPLLSNVLTASAASERLPTSFQDLRAAWTHSTRKQLRTS